jgi:hypothetical protein
MNSRFAAKKESVHLNKKIHKNRKWGTGGLAPHQKYPTVKNGYNLEGSGSSSCTGGKLILSKEILLVVNNGL